MQIYSEARKVEPEIIPVLLGGMTLDVGAAHNISNSTLLTISWMRTENPRENHPRGEVCQGGRRPRRTPHEEVVEFRLGLGPRG